MHVLEYFQPTTVEEALGQLTKFPQTTKILAGGTDLVIQLREREVEPDYLLDLTHIKELKETKKESGSLIIGCMATFSEIENNAFVKQHLPILAQAAASVGSPQIRNSGTIGGNIANAAPAADSVPALLALNAKVVLRNSNAKREIALEEILLGINKTAIKQDEILTQIVVPIPPSDTRSYFVKLGRRKALAIARINLALTLTFDQEKKINKSTLALGAVGTTAYRVSEVEEFLKGKSLTPELIAQAGTLISEVVAKKLGNRSTVNYKKRIAKATLTKAMTGIAADDKEGVR